jgi:hypothetical protein
VRVVGLADPIRVEDEAKSNMLAVGHGLRPYGQTSGPNASDVCRADSRRHSEMCEWTD